MEELTQKRLKVLLTFDSETGIFTWKINTANRVKAGNIAGYKVPDDYIVIGIDGKTKNFGYYDDKLSAAKARYEAELKYDIIKITAKT